jgi:hypothetical protein
MNMVTDGRHGYAEPGQAACATPKSPPGPDLLLYAQRSCLSVSSTCSWSRCSAGWYCWRGVMPSRRRVRRGQPGDRPAARTQPRRPRAGRRAKPGLQRRVVHRADRPRAQRRRAARLHGSAGLRNPRRTTGHLAGRSGG